MFEVHSRYSLVSPNKLCSCQGEVLMRKKGLSLYAIRVLTKILQASIVGSDLGVAEQLRNLRGM